MPRKKTISLSRNTLIAMFKAMAELLDEDTELAEKIRSELMRRIEMPSKTRIRIAGFLDKSISPEDMRKQLEEKTLEELVAIVEGYSLDTAKTIRKLKDRQRISELIIDRRNSLLNRYQGF
jgi:hypothetical protein